MTFDEYQKGVMETWNKTSLLDDQIYNAILGIIGELGEWSEHYKKMKFHEIAIDRERESKELGDILYYITALIHARGFFLQKIAEENNSKLKSRYPKGFKPGGGIR